MTSLVDRIKNAREGGSAEDASKDSEQPQESLDSILKEFPNGPLTHYRKKASFDWRKMRLFIEGEDIVRFRVSFIFYMVLRD